MKRKILLLSVFVVVIAILCTFTLSGCKNTTSGKTAETTTAATTGAAKETTAASEGPKYNKLTNVTVLKGHPVVQLMTAGFVKACNDLGYTPEVIATDGSDAAEVLSLAEAALAAGTDGMTVWAFDQAYYPFVEKCGAANVPVTITHFPVPEDEKPNGLIAYIGCDPAEYARAEAEAIGAEVGGKGTVAITVGSFNLAENMIAEEFTKYMNEHYPDIKVLEPQEEGFDPPVAISKCVAIIQANPDIVGAMSTTGGGPTAWSGAKDETNRPDLICTGNDYTRVNLDLVKSGKIFAVVAQPLFEEQVEAVKVLDQFIKTGEVEYLHRMPAPLVTIDNVDDYYALVDQAEAIMKEFNK